MLDNFLNRMTNYGLSSNTKTTNHYESSKHLSSETHSDSEQCDTTDSVIVSSANFVPRRSRPKLLERHKKAGRRFQTNLGLRQARSLGRLDTLKENENLGDYIRFRAESQSDLIDGRIKDLDRIQDLFANDFLGLHYPDVNYYINNAATVNGNNNTWNKKYLQRTYFRRFLDEAPCTVSNIHGIHTPRQRHLFLFSDILLLAKPRLGGNFKLKFRLRVSELWISPCNQESEIGFLLGWPILGSAKTVLLRFCTQAARDTWWKVLTNAIACQLMYEPKSTNIRVSCNDPTTGIYCRRTVNVTSMMNIMQIVQSTFTDMPAVQLKNYSLWACENGYTPCELIGLERPHAIQMSKLRQSLSTDEGFDLEHCNNTLTPCSIVFELRIHKISPMPKKYISKMVNSDCVSKYQFFGLPLNRLYANGILNPILWAILHGLYLNGLETEGIFRKCASAKVLRELKEKIERVGIVIYSELVETPPLLLSALLKEFLRNLPLPLLTGPSIQEWLHVDVNRTVHYLHSLLMKLPHDNYNLLSVIICLLFHIARRSNYNLMSAANLSVCLGPSFLWDPDNCSKPLKSLPLIVEMLIINCQTLFGSNVVSLLGTNAYNHNNNHNNDNTPNEELEVSQGGQLLSGQTCSADHKSESQDSGLMSSESERESPNSNFSSTMLYNQKPFDVSRSTNFSNKSSIDEDEAFGSSDDFVKSSKFDLMLTSSPNLKPFPPSVAKLAAYHDNRRLLIFADGQVVTYV